jgi:hypothetical protein
MSSAYAVDFYRTSDLQPLICLIITFYTGNAAAASGGDPASGGGEAAGAGDKGL